MRNVTVEHVRRVSSRERLLLTRFASGKTGWRGWVLTLRKRPALPLEIRMASEPDYYIITLETSGGPFPWRWEIKRRSKPMGLKLGAGGYPTQEAAARAGQQLLAAFLDELAREAKCE
jgi:hypothetical protein